MKPTIGRIVHYKLSAEDAVKINRRRTDGLSIAQRMGQGQWHEGAQAHIGNMVTPGQVFPMIITNVWSDVCVNGQVILDGNDTYWKTSPTLGTEVGQWNWPAREPEVKIEGNGNIVGDGNVTGAAV